MLVYYDYYYDQVLLLDYRLLLYLEEMNILSIDDIIYYKLRPSYFLLTKLIWQ